MAKSGPIYVNNNSSNRVAVISITTHLKFLD